VRRKKHVGELAQIEDDVATTAQAAATAAAHDVEAANAAQAASRSREAHEDGTVNIPADAARSAADAATTADAYATSAAELAEVSGEATVLESPPLAEPYEESEDVEGSSARESHDGTEAPERAPSVEGDGGSDLLGLDSPGAKAPRVLARLGLLTLLGAAGSFVLSLLLVAIVAEGTVVDVIVLIAWLGAAVMSIAGVLLIAAAGITRAAGASAQARSTTNNT
jgi:hypothetical protein